MKHLSKNLFMLCALAISAACATQGGGNKESVAAAMTDTDIECAFASNEREYRNPYLRARHIGTSPCAR